MYCRITVHQYFDDKAYLIRIVHFYATLFDISHEENNWEQEVKKQRKRNKDKITCKMRP